MIFPDWGESPARNETAELPLYTEWAMDWDTGAFALRNGRPYTVTGTEALRIWVKCALHPESMRFAYTAHTHDYGNELSALLGGVTDQGILESRLRQSIRETLLVSPYIVTVDGFSFRKSGSCVEADFTVRTIYEEFTQKLEVPIG